MRCFFCSAPDAQHRDPSEPECLGRGEDEIVIDQGLERALTDIAGDTADLVRLERREEKA